MCGCKTEVYPIYSVMRTCKWCGRQYESYRSGSCCGLKCEREYRAATHIPSTGDDDGCGCWLGILIAVGIVAIIVFKTIDEIKKGDWGSIVINVTACAITLVIVIGIGYITNQNRS